MNVFVKFLLLCLACHQAHSCYVHEDLMKYVETRSNPDVIPQTSIDKPVNVSLSMNLINIRAADLATGAVEIEVWLTMTWNSSITFEPEQFNGLNEIRLPVRKIWLPDVTVYNGELHIHDDERVHHAVLHNSGNTLWVPKAKLVLWCDLSEEALTNNVTCTGKVGSWTYSATHMSLNEETHFDVADYVGESKFEVLETSAKREVQSYACCVENYEDILFSVTFRRRS